MKKFLIVLFILVIAAIYLNKTYAYFYNSLSMKPLLPPAYPTEMTFGNPDGEKFTFVSLGDSLTAGVGVSDYKNSYPYLVAQKLALKNNVKLINLAHMGDTSSEVVNNQLPKVLMEKPNLITILIGVNDIHNLVSLKKFEDNVTQIIKSLKQTNAKIYLLSLPYLGSDKIIYFPYNFILDFRTKQFNNVIRKISVDYGVEYINLYSLNKSAGFYSSDQFHPGEAGYKEWSEAINVN